MSATTSRPATGLLDNDWPTTTGRNNVLYGTAMSASDQTFNGTITITDSSHTPQTVVTWNLRGLSGQASAFLGHKQVNPGTASNQYTYPLNISASITASGNSLDYIVQDNQQMGTKVSGNNSIPISFQTTMFFNDSGGDNDYNDCVLTFTLFNESRDY